MHGGLGSYSQGPSERWTISVQKPPSITPQKQVNPNRILPPIKGRWWRQRSCIDEHWRGTKRVAWILSAGFEFRRNVLRVTTPTGPPPMTAMRMFLVIPVSSVD